MSLTCPRDKGRDRPMILGTVTITLITGANKGLGREAARRLLKVGHTVLVGARDAERGQRTANELGAVFLQIDPTSDASVAAAADRVRSKYGRLDVLVNNAGTAEPRVGAADLNRRCGNAGLRHKRVRAHPGHARVPASPARL